MCIKISGSFITADNHTITESGKDYKKNFPNSPPENSPKNSNKQPQTENGTDRLRLHVSNALLNLFFTESLGQPCHLPSTHVPSSRLPLA